MAALRNTKRRAPLPPAAPSVTPAGPAVPSDPKPAVPDMVSITCPALGLRELVSSSPKVKSLPHLLMPPQKNGLLFLMSHCFSIPSSFSVLAAVFLFLLLFILFSFALPSLHCPRLSPSPLFSIPPFCCSASVVCIRHLNTGMHYAPYACVMRLLAQCFGACN